MCSCISAASSLDEVSGVFGIFYPAMVVIHSPPCHDGNVKPAGKRPTRGSPTELLGRRRHCRLAVHHHLHHHLHHGHALHHVLVHAAGHRGHACALHRHAGHAGAHLAHHRRPPAHLPHHRHAVLHGLHVVLHQ